MTTPSKFYYPVTVHQEGNQYPELAPFVAALPSAQNPDELVAILGMDAGDQAQGLYVFDDVQWRYALPMEAVSASIIRGDALDFYVYPTTSTTAGAGANVYKNGIPQSSNIIAPGRAIYGVRTPPAGGGGGVGAVTSVNGQTGVVIINAGNLSGLASVAVSGNYSDLNGVPTPFVLDKATATVLGGVVVPLTSNLVVDGTGAIDTSAAFNGLIAGKINSVVASGAGVSLVLSSTAGVATIKGLVAGTNLTVVDGGNGVVTLNSTYTLPVATASVLGGVKQGAGILIAGDGTISSTYNLPVATTSVLGGVKQGTGVTIAADGTISVSGTTYVLPVATALTLGGVKEGAGVNIAADGTLSIAYTIPVASSTVLGGVKQGTGVSIAGDGTISSSVPLATTSTVGTVKVGSGLSIDGTGLLTANGAVPATATTLGSVIVGSGLTVAGDGTISVSTVASVTSVNTKTGAVTIVSGAPGITVDNSGASISVNLALTSALVTGALGFTPYNATNPSNYLTANQNITYTGDVTGAGTTAVTLALANSGITAAGTYTKVTVDMKGRVTAGTNPTDLAGYGITNALNTLTGGSVGGTVTLTGGAKLTGVPNPVNDPDAANKAYVDLTVGAVANGTSWRQNADVGTTANIALTGLQTIDGVAVVAGDRVLVKNQTAGEANGVYVAAATAWARSVDTDTGPELEGMAILILKGTTQSLTQWVNTNTGTITLGTTPVTFTQLQGQISPYAAGAGLTLTANTFSITPTGVAAATYDKVTVNALGQVTAGDLMNAADITTALGFTPYNSSNPSNYLTSNQAITLSGDAAGTGTTAIAVVLANTTVTPGTWKSVTVDAKGRVTGGTNPTTLAGYGITDAAPLAAPAFTGAASFAGTVVVPTPTLATQAATKGYVDTATSGIVNSVTWKTRAAAATTANITLTNTQTIDGYAAVVGDRVLVKNQTTAADNGLYIVAAGAWTRATDAATGLTLLGMTVVVLNGTTNALTQWINTNTAAINIGVTAVTFAQTAGGAGEGGTYTAGTGLTLTANTFSITNTGVAAAQYTKVTVNAQGQVTAATQLASADVTTALGFTPLQNNQAITLSGDITGTGATAITTALSVTGVTAGQYTRVTVDTKGRVTAGDQLSNAEIVAALGFTPLNQAGGSLVQMTGALNLAPTVNVAAASTTAVGSAGANDIQITGNGININGFDSAPIGATRTVHFLGANTLVHNAGTFVLPNGGANISTAIGDAAQFTFKAGNAWVCDWYQKANGAALQPLDATKLPLAGGTLTGALNYAPPVTLASAATLNIGAAAANDISVSGTVAVTSLGPATAGTIRKLTFLAALTLTYNATSLILPQLANVATGAGDVAQFTSLGGSNWRCDFYTKAGGSYVTSTGVDTLTNKTLSNSVISGFVEGGAVATGAAFSPDFTVGTDFEYTTNANTTLTLPAAQAGRSYTITIKYGGAHTVAFAGGTLVKFQNGTPPIATSVAGKWDVYVFKCDRAGTATMVMDGGRNF